MISWDQITLHMAQEHRDRVASMPKWRLVCGRDWFTQDFRMGLYWGKNDAALEGKRVYSHEWLIWLHFSFKIWINHR